MNLFCIKPKTSQPTNQPIQSNPQPNPTQPHRSIDRSLLVQVNAIRIIIVQAELCLTALMKHEAEQVNVGNHSAVLFGRLPLPESTAPRFGVERWLQLDKVRGDQTFGSFTRAVSWVWIWLKQERSIVWFSLSERRRCQRRCLQWTRSGAMLSNVTHMFTRVRIDTVHRCFG